MSCLYTINTGSKRTPILTKSQLYLYILQSHASTWEELVAFTGDTRLSLVDSQKDILDRIRSKRLKVQRSRSLDSSIDFKLAISACHFIEKYIPNLGGLQAQVDENAFRQWVIESQINTNVVSQEEKNQIADKIIKSWEIIEVDSIDLHNLIAKLWSTLNSSDSTLFESTIRNFVGIDGTNNIYNKLKNTTKSGVDGITLLRSQMEKLNSKLNTLAKVEEDKSTLYAGLHFDSKLVNDLERVGVHIDKLYLDSSGNLHVINFKFTLSDPNTWCTNKIIKYEYEMAMVKKILADNGLSVKNATFINIPIVLEYDNENIINIRIPNTDSDGIKSYNVETSNRGKVSSPIARREQEVDKYFNAPKIEFNNLTLSSRFEESDLFIKVLNPEYDATSEGLKISAKEWIKDNYRLGNIRMDHKKQKYKIILPTNEEIYVDSLVDPLKNQEILEVVQEHIEELNQENTVIMPEIIKGIKNAYQRGKTYFDARGFKFNQGYLQASLSKYLIQRPNASGELEYEWELLTDEDSNNVLSNRGILLFLNKKTKQLDTVIASPFYSKALIPMKYSQSGILGQHIMDIGSTSVLSASYGNMELMRVASILNEIKKDLPENVKFGDIKIITPHNRGEGLTRDAKYVINEYSKICRFLNQQSPENQFKSNFTQNDFIDPVSLIFSTYDDIINMCSSSESANYLFNIDGLKNQRTLAGQLQAVEELIESIESSNKIGSTPEEIVKNLHSSDPVKRGTAYIYLQAVKFLNYHTGFKQAQVLYLSQFERLALPQYANSDENVRHVSNLYTKALDRIAEQFQTSYTPIRSKILDFYKKKGFGNLQSTVIGSAEKLYENFYEKNQDGSKTWNFVNPYDPVSSRNLDEDEKRILKIALYQFNKIRSQQSGINFNFEISDINSSAYMNFIHNHQNTFFLVPLKKASKGHQMRHSVEDKVNSTKEEFKKWNQLGSKEYMQDLISRRKKGTQYDDGAITHNESIYDMSVENHMSMSEIPEHRVKLIKQHDDNYFETNVEYLLADYTEQSIAKQNLDKVALYGKCMLFQMYLQGEEEGQNNTKLLKKSASEIEDFLKLNVYNKSLLDDMEQAFVQFMSPARRLMTNLYIAANLRSAFRDSFEGLWQNMVRTISHYQNDLTQQSLMAGYKEVVQNVFKNDRALNICSELCLRYRLSNTDSAKISERAKTGKGGIFNPSEFAFSTLRAPDFLNRMTLFVARCKQDGVWDAFSINDGQLVYNWKKDKRFKIFAEGITDHPDYAKQQALYYNSIDRYNKEHGASLTFTDSLPEPYSQDEIRRFKEFSDGIYGAYDKSQKSKYEHLVLGQTLGIFSTWFNGHTAAWFRRRGFYDPYFTQEDDKGNMLIKRNDAGNELWFDKDGNIYEKRDDKFYNEDTGEEVTIQNPVPVMDRMPVQVQGIWYTLKDSWHVLSESGFSYNEFKKNVLNYECNIRNFQKLGFDLLSWAILAALFGFIFTPMYDDHKKRKDVDNFLQDALIELLYKSAANSYEGFMGPVAIANYILNNVEPSAANVSVKITSDLWKVLLGDKTVTAFATGYVPVVRTFKDTAKIYFGSSFKVEK